MSPGYLKQITVPQKVFSITGKTPSIVYTRVSLVICKCSPLSFAIISQSDRSGDNGAVMEKTELGKLTRWLSTVQTREKIK